MGRSFANWPAAGAEHRVNLLRADLGDLVVGFRARAPSDLFNYLRDATRLRALQCGEFGPFRQVIAGLDIALWDLFARRAGVPLRRMLTPQAGDQVPIYASGIHIGTANAMIENARRAGATKFKVKVGFDVQSDIAAVRDLHAEMNAGESLMADANQAWDLKAATAFASGVAATQLDWLEEPLPAYTPQEAWQALSQATPIPLAAGENIAGHAAFEEVLAQGYLGIVQPDVVKWGGLKGCHKVARRALQSGARYCPHFLGGGIGLAASAELLAAVGGDGVLEVDINPNPLREAFEVCEASLNGADWRFSDRPGLGIEALPETLKQYQTAYIEL